MELKEHVQSETYVITIIGGFDSINSVETLNQALHNATDYSEINIDLSQATFISSVFVNAIAAFRNKFPIYAARIRLINPSSGAMDVLKITGMDKIFPIMNI